jgi:hypothetical protein
MNEHPLASDDRDALLDDFTAELARVAYRVALRHGTAGVWVDLELDLWRALADTVKTWGQGSAPFSEAARVCDCTTAQFEAAPADVRNGFGHWESAQEPFSGE